MLWPSWFLSIVLAWVNAPRPIEHRETCGAATAILRGERADGFDEYTSLAFDLGGGPIRMPTGDMYFSDWSFDVFSPDCRHVLLLQSHYGPYHVVQTRRLAKYLRGAAPDHVLDGSGVFHDGAWISNGEVRYESGCCDPPITTRFSVPD